MTPPQHARAKFSYPGLPGALARILSLQRSDGAIPWLEGGALDPWNHIEAAMALSVAGHHDAAEKAYGFLRDSQLPDGSWWGDYGNAVPMEDHTHLARTPPPRGRDSNFTAYIATGVWHHYLITRDRHFLARAWPMVEKAMAFVLSLQTVHGDIAWAVAADGQPADDALIAGCCSIYKSLECAVKVAQTLMPEKVATPARWARARTALGQALRHKPHRFDRQGQSHARFSMDWYYPVLTGVITGEAARARLKWRWPDFVVDGLGCRCVSDQPWVTVAESCELVMALVAVGERALARTLLDWQHQWRDSDGSYWMGYQFEENIMWPEEKPAWTSAALVLAMDALTSLSPAASLFNTTPAPLRAQHLSAAT